MIAIGLHVRTPGPGRTQVHLQGTTGLLWFCRTCDTEWRENPACPWCGHKGIGYASMTQRERSSLSMYSPGRYTAEGTPTKEGL